MAAVAQRLDGKTHCVNSRPENKLMIWTLNWINLWIMIHQTYCTICPFEQLGLALKLLLLHKRNYLKMINGKGYPQSDFYSLWVYGWWMYLYFVTIKLIKSTIKGRNQANMLCHLNEQNTGKIIQIGMETWLLSKIIINIWGLPSPCQYLSKYQRR